MLTEIDGIPSFKVTVFRTDILAIAVTMEAKIDDPSQQIHIRYKRLFGKNPFFGRDQF